MANMLANVDTPIVLANVDFKLAKNIGSSPGDSIQHICNQQFHQLRTTLQQPHTHL